MLRSILWVLLVVLAFQFVSAIIYAQEPLLRPQSPDAEIAVQGTKIIDLNRRVETLESIGVERRLTAIETKLDESRPIQLTSTGATLGLLLEVIVRRTRKRVTREPDSQA